MKVEDGFLWISGGELKIEHINFLLDDYEFKTSIDITNNYYKDKYGIFIYRKYRNIIKELFYNNFDIQWNFTRDIFSIYGIKIFFQTDYPKKIFLKKLTKNDFDKNGGN